MAAPMNRRTALRLAAGGLATIPLASACSELAVRGGGNVETQGSAGAVLRSAAPLPRPFTLPLRIPDVLRPTSTHDGTDYCDITQREERQEILPGLKTAVWGYEGRFPGPTLVSRRGRQTVVRHHNALPVPTVVHLHGGKTPAEHDGYPTDLVQPGARREYVYPLDQPAATLWYHDHRMDFTGPQVYRGLAGFHLVHDDEEDRLGLPSGDRDIPLLITDRAFHEDGSFRYPSRDPSLRGEPGVTDDFMSGVLGDCVLVNGVPWPVLEVEGARYRFRLLNGSNARRYHLALDPPPPGGVAFTQVGGDQGLLAAPVEHERLPIAQAERFDVVVDFSAYRPGQEVTLINTLGRGGTRDVLRFVVTRRGRDDSRVPSRLAELEPLSRDQARVERDFVFARGGAEHHGTTLWTVNGEPFSPDHVAAEVRPGSVELWRIRVQNVAHPVHLHLVPFQVLDGGPTTAGWKDTVDLDSGGQADLLVRFPEDPSYAGRYVFHCHNLEHEDMMMMANFDLR
ncbi:multicopper oxidase family protein [Saccharomonospora piscinae]|uniref:multicopper oxidase family protein n=1 Tax=Saccharomonospora piscinae TaxID=687388 RepID=UPI001107486A|nr:multicopper oxidase domain-containing protein [Saccharomonospora piscinae]TLW91252.1 multicopper oxidase family protein [Saccharomonospora piscinae]